MLFVLYKTNLNYQDTVICCSGLVNVKDQIIKKQRRRKNFKHQELCKKMTSLVKEDDRSFLIEGNAVFLCAVSLFSILSILIS